MIVHDDQLMSREQIANRLGVSRSRIRQIEERALRKLHAAIVREATAAGVSIREWLFGDPRR
jgi:DNA-directed RNA polymerase sigma subunit (sigma70/sigma32)